MASNFDNKTFKVDGAPLASLAKGLSAFRQQSPPHSKRISFAVLSCELKLKRGHIVGRQVAVVRGENGGLFWIIRRSKATSRGELSTSKEKTHDCSDSSQSCWSRMSNYVRCMRPLDWGLYLRNIISTQTALSVDCLRWNSPGRSQTDSHRQSANRIARD